MSDLPEVPLLLFPRTLLPPRLTSSLTCITTVRNGFELPRLLLIFSPWNPKGHILLCLASFPHDGSETYPCCSLILIEEFRYLSILLLVDVWVILATQRKPAMHALGHIFEQPVRICVQYRPAMELLGHEACI